MPPDPPLRVQVTLQEIIVSLPGSTYAKADMNCPHDCPLIKIDYYGDMLVGCMPASR